MIINCERLLEWFFVVGKINDRNCKVALNYKVQYRYRYLIYKNVFHFDSVYSNISQGQSTLYSKEQLSWKKINVLTKLGQFYCMAYQLRY